MKDLIAKVAPIAIGIALGWMLLAAPDWFEGLGALRYVVGAVLVLALLVGVVIGQILASLPTNVSLEPLPETERGDLRELSDGFTSLGFSAAGPPLKVGVAPPAVLIPFVNEAARSYGTVFRTGTIPAKTSYDFVSILEGFRGGLTTGPEWKGATLPAGPGELRQVIPGVSLASLFQHHVEAVDYLRTRGLPMKQVSASAFAGDFRAAIAYQRRSFLANPVVNAILAIWRSATSRVPHMGPLAGQKTAQEQLLLLLTGRRS